ncbi:hypothetical protein CMV_003954 [Castanea mollissima]|uniref:TF-B3 domain-containing protein n=1 Tax=Castanea mollissima TaxID=60419 RepID=A0A8J4RN70_9ROSI|nr:hypothetical protein CMV_003954 [Castanea mollissima]
MQSSFGHIAKRDGDNAKAKSPHFLKIILADTSRRNAWLWDFDCPESCKEEHEEEENSTCKYRVPRKFISKYGGGLSNAAYLKLPHGAEWKVELTDGDGEGWFQNGWHEFANYHSLKQGHLLVLRYEGHSPFYVLIFDASATEIDYSFDDKLHVPKMEDIESDDNSVEILDGLRPSQKTRKKSAEVTKATGTILEKSKMNAGLPSKEECSGTTRCLKLEVIEKMQPLSASVKDRALYRARVFESRNPFFTVVMQPSYFQDGRLNISCNFANKYLRKTNNDIILWVSDEGNWSIRVRFRESRTGTRAEFCRGWKAFTEDNNLKVGDVCVFELINSIEVAFKVAIFQAGKDIDCPVLNVSTHVGGGNRGPKSDCSLDDYPSKEGGRGRSTSQRCLKVKAFQKKKELNIKGRARTIERARAFKSQNPFFMVTMRPSYLCGKGHMHVPRGFMNYLPKEGFIKEYAKGIARIVMLQVADRLWPVKLTSYLCAGAAYQFSSGWSAFVRENTLQVGDVCVFELVMMRDDVVFKVHIFKCPE